MWLTWPVSGPASWFLDRIAAGALQEGLYSSHDELIEFIRYHEESSLNGGPISSYGSRIMRSALEMDIKAICPTKRLLCNGDVSQDEDIESKPRNDVDTSNIVDWRIVKHIRIDDEVCPDLIARIKSWGYSRLPVVGGLDISNIRNTAGDAVLCSGNERVYGFLHVKVMNIPKVRLTYVIQRYFQISGSLLFVADCSYRISLASRDFEMVILSESRISYCIPFQLSPQKHP